MVRLVGHDSVTIMLCLCHLLGQDGVGFMKPHHLTLRSDQLLLSDWKAQEEQLLTKVRHL
jgi:hypothetical protein